VRKGKSSGGVCSTAEQGSKKEGPSRKEKIVEVAKESKRSKKKKSPIALLGPEAGVRREGSKCIIWENWGGKGKETHAINGHGGGGHSKGGKRVGGVGEDACESWKNRRRSSETTKKGKNPEMNGVERL